MPAPEGRTGVRRRAFLAGAGAAVPLLAGPRGAFDARAFGAAGDGARDDTAALQAALDAAADSGGTVVFPPGVYLTRTLTIRSRVHLAGSGPEATVLKLRDGTDADLLRTLDRDRLAGSDSVGGPFNWSVRGLTLDGNRARNAAGCGLRAYGWGFTLADLRVRQCAGAGVDSEWGTGDPPYSEKGLNTPGDSMEAQVVNLKVHDCGAGGVVWRGPHDSQFANVVVYDTTTVGIHFRSGPKFSATGCQLVNGHVWGGHVYGVAVEAGYVTLVNLMAEWAKSAQVRIVDDDATVAAGRFFGNPKARHVGIEIGAPGREVYGTSVDARMADLNGGAFRFTAEGGSGQIRALVYQTSGMAYTGRPSRGTRLELVVNGIEADNPSATWIPRSPLGWNGGTPIVRHLSATAAWSPKPVPPGKAAWTEVAVERAAPGDTVAVGFSRPLPAGAVLSGTVSAPGVVSVTLLNATGRVLAPGAGAVRADCWVH